LAWGADVNAKDTADFTPLHLAVKELDKNQKLSTIKKLVFKGANINARDALNRKPIDLAEHLQDKRLKMRVTTILN